MKTTSTRNYIGTLWWILRGALCFLGYIAANLITVGLCLIAWVILFPFSRVKKRAISAIIRTILRAQFMFLMPATRTLSIKIEGLQNLEKGAVIVANHISLLDPLLILATVPNCAVAIKKEYENFLAMILLKRLFDFIVVDANKLETTKKLFERALDTLKIGRSILIFPEGTRAKAGRLLEFKKSAFKLAKELNAPLIPAVIHADRPFFPKGGKLFPMERANYNIEFLEKLDSSNFKTTQKLADTTYNLIANALKQAKRR